MSVVNEDPIAVLEDTSEGILHAVYDIIKGVERDGGVDDKVSQLRGRLESARSLVQSLKGTDLSPDEQLEKAELLQSKLVAKRRLLSTYKHMCGLFELPEGGGNGQQTGSQGSQASGGAPGSNGLLNGDADHISSHRDPAGSNGQGTPDPGMLPQQNSAVGSNQLL
ncbi:mediator of RNA polymerase II transcription subunit 9-like [Varroa jacobsoni]|uniref:Mediator of RNA polymerase II transcription subunit 9 n=1 Tax=Varroa destructor TaxID=109461 RepID=A0A7M7MBK0_VARDE|nr:mediator of RNA polymerase II transcription subunit 9-like isoform X1 [Varroa destructor]XP_022691871.1 mediator of RNA polymerase II transcription subunit 9-like [Varroa jacobsoni]